jgi:hypothetical protein
MNDQQSISPRSRLQELLAIPERQRSDAQWEEINDLEITLASANRADTGGSGARRNTHVADDRPKPSGRTQGKKPFKKPHKRPPKENTP